MTGTGRTEPAVAAAGDLQRRQGETVPGGRAVPALALFQLPKVLKIERSDVMAGRV